jgi:hypothetical protein
MAEMLLINPRKRRGVRKARRVVARRRRNPLAAAVSPVRRRRNPLARMRTMSMRKRVMRRRNPIGAGMAGGYMGAIREAVMGGAGAVAMDLLYGQIDNFLPAMLKKTPGSVGTGDAVKALATVFIGQALNKVTKGFSGRAAKASLTVQAHDIIKSFVPSTMTMGYASPALITGGSNRVGPIKRGMSAYIPGSTLLNAYVAPGSTPMLSGARRRETAVY